MRQGVPLPNYLELLFAEAIEVAEMEVVDPPHILYRKYQSDQLAFYT